MKNRILVIGGTGTTGRSVIDLLQKNKADYKALVRDKDKAKALELEGIPTIIGTLGEWSTVEPAFNDVDTIYLVTSPVPEMFDLHKGVIDMAVKKGVRKNNKPTKSTTGSFIIFKRNILLSINK